MPKLEAPKMSLNMKKLSKKSSGSSEHNNDITKLKSLLSMASDEINSGTVSAGKSHSENNEVKSSSNSNYSGIKSMPQNRNPLVTYNHKFDREIKIIKEEIEEEKKDSVLELKRQM